MASIFGNGCSLMREVYSSSIHVLAPAIQKHRFHVANSASTGQHHVKVNHFSSLDPLFNFSRSSFA
jgi:hypothetical protein